MKSRPAEPKRRVGRPARIEPRPGQRVPLGLRVTYEIKTALDAAARQSGRSQSQEAEARLERSFRDDEILAELRALRSAVEEAPPPSRFKL